MSTPREYDSRVRLPPPRSASEHPRVPDVRGALQSVCGDDDLPVPGAARAPTGPAPQLHGRHRRHPHHLQASDAAAGREGEAGGWGGTGPICRRQNLSSLVDLCSKRSFLLAIFIGHFHWSLVSYIGHFYWSS